MLIKIIKNKGPVGFNGNDSKAAAGAHRFPGRIANWLKLCESGEPEVTGKNEHKSWTGLLMSCKMGKIPLCQSQQQSLIKHFIAAFPVSLS